MTVEESLQVIAFLVLSRHLFETTQGEAGDASPNWAAAVHAAFREDASVAEAIGREVRDWSRRGWGAPDPELPQFERMHGDQLNVLVDVVQSVSDLGEFYETCLEWQSRTSGKGGNYYTPVHISELVVAMLAPRRGESVYDPACGSGGFFVQACKYVEQQVGRPADLALHGQDVSREALQMAAMNLTVHGEEGRLAEESSLTADAFPGQTFDVVLANPPFNQSRWDGGGRAYYDDRWVYGAPPRGNANFAWVQHILSKMSPTGRGGILLPNGAASGARPAERAIRKALVESDVLDCVVALPAGLLSHVRNPVCLWLFTKNKKPRDGRGIHDRRSQVLFVDAREAVATVGRGQRVLATGANARIADTYAAWRGSAAPASYQDERGWARSVTTQEIAEREYDVQPAHFVGEADEAPMAGDGVERVAELTTELLRHFERSRLIEDELRNLLRRP
ncbi:HsdM family class I SAM-dependent methyltransferase [Streptomyces rimosus]|uniref:HsdM family class I SAM-dependent methyltransferase n=1 Tax=Streptomyces rimosus TaxID=1927 RepID=UPI00131D9858|nr:N-6 DNA methylase [Streptomyces rimosus]